jgi:hypothetical protein
MKGLAIKLTEDNLVIKNYVIVPSSAKFATHNYFSLPEVLCQEMVDKQNRGQRYSLDSRYIYSCAGFSSNHKGIEFGTAKAAVQTAIWEHFGDIRYLKIIKIEDDEETNSIPKETLDSI